MRQEHSSTASPARHQVQSFSSPHLPVDPRPLLREQAPKKPWTPKEQEYLDKMASAPIIYKRIPEQEFYPSVG